MRKSFIGMLFILLAGCSLFTSEDLHNDTAKDAASSFLQATFSEDEELVDKLAEFDADKQDDVMDLVVSRGLVGSDADVCDVSELGDARYGAICENADEEDVYVTLALDESDAGYLVEDVVMKPAVAFTFRQDDPELTDAYVADLEGMINREFPLLDDEEKVAMKFKVYAFADAFMGLYDGDDAILDHSDREKFKTLATLENEDELLDLLENMLPEISDDAVISAIEFGSFYDIMEGFFIRDEEDYQDVEDTYDLKMDEMHMIDLTLTDEDGEDLHVFAPLYEDGDKLIVWDFTDYDESVFATLTYNIEPGKTLKEEFQEQIDEEDIDDDRVNEDADDEGGIGDGDDVNGAGDDDSDGNENESDKEQDGKAEMMEEGESLYQSNCMSCHAEDRSGSVGPNIRNVKDKYSEDELVDIMVNGKGSMPGIVEDEDDAKIISEWLLEME